MTYDEMNLYEIAGFINRADNDGLLTIDVNGTQYKLGFITCAPGEIILYTKEKK